jgi:cytochrome c oxidase subunit 4
MASTKLYGIIFVVLASLTTTQFVLEKVLIDEVYWIALGIIMALSTIKAMAVAGWYMHMIEEPRAITYVALAGVMGVVALTAGAAYSVT